MRLIFLVIASEDPIHQADLQVQKQTWVSSLPESCQVIWLRGSENNDYLVDGNTLYVPCPENYANILEKTILGIQFVANNLNFDIVVRTNVSTYFDFPRLRRELGKSFYKNAFVGGYFDKTSGGYFGRSDSYDYISGTGPSIAI